MNTFISVLIFYVLSAAHVQAVPLDTTAADPAAVNTHGPTTKVLGADDTNMSAVTSIPIEIPDLDTAAATEEKEIVSAGAELVPDNIASASNFDPSIYAGLLTPDAFQQYVNQFGVAAAYAPYAAYPGAAGYAPPPPPIYPSPYVVQTGYEGFLVPSTSTTSTSTAPTTTTTTTEAATTTTTPATGIASVILNPLMFLASLFPTLFMSTVFKVIAAVLSAIGMIVFGGAITTALCNLTPLCDISFKAVTYMRGRGAAENVGRLIAEEMTPERVRRAAEMVQSAIRKYRLLQELIDNDADDNLE